MSQSESRERAARELWLARLARGHQGKLVVRSGSMLPLLVPGETLITVSARGHVWPGDLVVFQKDDRFICHRIMVPYAPGRYWEKGDMNREWERIRAQDIIARPILLATADKSVSLTGVKFRFYNSLVWFLVALRDLARIITRPLPRGTSSVERLFCRLIDAIIEQIR